MRSNFSKSLAIVLLLLTCPVASAQQIVAPKASTKKFRVLLRPSVLGYDLTIVGTNKTGAIECLVDRVTLDTDRFSFESSEKCVATRKLIELATRAGKEVILTVDQISEKVILVETTLESELNPQVAGNILPKLSSPNYGSPGQSHSMPNLRPSSSISGN